ncbi:MAG: hypothetical protein IPJ94_18580 [Chloroflexi bacterium]|nr:hypothetical protein [Chloroflexota bacterium]
MKRNKVSVVWKTAVTLAMAALLVSVWPHARSLYDLTGEENLAAQLRGVGHWVNTAVRPQPSLATDAAIENTAVSPSASTPFCSKKWNRPNASKA